MANHGKRMVKESLIAQIGQGTTYTAGDNITIDEDNVISATNTTYNSGVGIYIQSDGNAIDLDYNDTTTVSVDIDENNRANWNVNLVQDGGITTDLGGLKVDSSVVAMQTDLPDAVSGTNDGTNWTSITIGNSTYNIPSGSEMIEVSGNGNYIALSDEIYNKITDYTVILVTKGNGDVRYLLLVGPVSTILNRRQCYDITNKEYYSFDNNTMYLKKFYDDIYITTGSKELYMNDE